MADGRCGAKNIPDGLCLPLCARNQGSYKKLKHGMCQKDINTNFKGLPMDKRYNNIHQKEWQIHWNISDMFLNSWVPHNKKKKEKQNHKNYWSSLEAPRFQLIILWKLMNGKNPPFILPFRYKLYFRVTK